MCTVGASDEDEKLWHRSRTNGLSATLKRKEIPNLVCLVFLDLLVAQSWAEI